MEKKKEKEAAPMSLNDARSLVEKYFKNVRVSHLNVFYPHFGRLEVDVSYEDFKPERVVREELERMIPHSIVNPTRDFSDEQGKKVFFRAWNDCEPFEMLIDGKMQEVDLRHIIYKYLEDKTL